MMHESGERSRSHALPPQVIAAQAAALGLPIVARGATWQAYEQEFILALQSFRQAGVQLGVFGDIDIEANGAWERKVCATAGLTAWLPLWQESRQRLLWELIDLGFQAMIISVKADRLDRSFLGRVLTRETVQELMAAGIDPSGEEGEYHTVVTNGPLFKYPISIKLGVQELHAGYWFQSVDV
jgi:uncharacterized protein (TIGR00290 family)